MASCQVALSGRLQEKREPRLKKNNEAKMSLMSCIDWYIRSASHKRMEPKAKAKGINQRGRVETKPFDPHTKSLDWIYSNFFVGEGGSEMKNPFASFSLTWSLCHLSEGPGEQSAAAAAGGNIRSISRATNGSVGIAERIYSPIFSGKKLNEWVGQQVPDKSVQLRCQVKLRRWESGRPVVFQLFNQVAVGQCISIRFNSAIFSDKYGCTWETLAELKENYF